MLQFTKDDIMRGIELGVMALLGLLVLFLGVRPLVRRVTGSDLALGGAPGRRRCGGMVATSRPRARGIGGSAPGAIPGSGVNVTGGGNGSITIAGGPNVSLVGGDANRSPSPTAPPR